MRGKRVLSMVAVMLLLVTVVLGGVMPAPVAAQADELSQREFDDLIETAQEEDPAFGPEDGELEQDPDIVTMVYAGQELADVLATVTIANPYAGSSQQFDYGIQFRTFSEDDAVSYLRFIVVSTGSWGISDAEGEFILTGEYGDLDDSRNGENELTVYAEGPLVHVGINGDYVGSVEVDLEDAGDVAVGTSFFGDSYEEGAVSEFSDFTVWEIGGSGRATGDDEDEPTPDDEDDSDDRGPLGPRGGDDEEDQPTEEADDEPTRDDDDEPTPDDGDEPTAEPEDEDEPTRDDDDDSGNAASGGTVYESPTYGYSLQYDESIWEVTVESAEEGLDTLVLDNELSTLSFFALPTTESMDACLEVLLTSLLGSFEEAGLSGELETIDSGEFTRGPLDGGAYVETLFTAPTDDGDLELSIYVACGSPGGDDYVVGVRHFVVADDYEDEAELRDEIVATISADGQPADTGNDEDEPTAEPEDEDEPSRDDEDEPARDVEEDEPAQAGALYESPSYGFSLRYDDSVWELSGESSDEGIDTASLSNGISTVVVYGLPSSSTPAECIEALIAVFIGSLEEAGIIGELEVANEGEVADGPLAGSEFAEVVFVAETDDGNVALAIYVSCGTLGGGDHYVGVRHFVLPDAYEGEAASRDDLLAGLGAEGEAPVETGNDDEDEPADNDGDEPARDEDDDSGSADIDSPNVSRVDGAVIYTSPTYGFTVEIQRGFSVEQDTVANGYDTLVISNSNARITVAGFASSNSAASCVDSIVANLNADPSFSNVTLPVDEAGAPIRIDEDGFSAVPVYLTYTEGGEQVVVGRLYACFSFTGVNGGAATLVYAYETPADIFIDEFDNIVATLDLILVP